MDHPAFMFLFALLSPLLLLGAVAVANNGPQILMVAVGMLIPEPNQPRKFFDKDKLNELAGSIKERGMFNPVRVRWDAERQVYVIVAGERRYRAALMLGLKEIPCIVVEAVSEIDQLADALAENLVRADFSPMEVAKGFERYMRLANVNGSELAAKLHVSNATVSRSLKLLLLPSDLQEKVGTGPGMIEPSVAYELAGFPEPNMREWAERVMHGKATRAQVQEARHALVGKKNFMPKDNKLPVQLNGARATLSNGSEWTPEAVEEFAKALLKRARAAKGKGGEEFRNFMKGEGE